MALSAGILLYRTAGDLLEVLIGHPGGPFWRGKHEGAWSIPKGLVEPGEDPLEAALREFAEETGHSPNPAQLLPLGSVELASGKEVVAWGVAGDVDPAGTSSNLITIEWPRGTGRMIEFPEIDEVRWCSPLEAKKLLNRAQGILVDRLQESLNHSQY